MFDNNIAWYYQVWCWAGLGAAIVLLIMLFATNILRLDGNKSRWKDPTWLAWLASVGYLLHNVEEYGLDLTGTMYSFPKAMKEMIGFMPGGVFIMAVNISIVWFVGPIAAYISRKYRIMSVGMMGFMLVNSFAHVIPLIITGEYNPGLFTALAFFLPVSIWVIYARFGEGKLKFSALAAVIGIGIISHLVLFGTIIGFYRTGIIGENFAAVIQVLNAILMFSLWYGAERIAGGKLAEIKHEKTMEY